MITRHHVIHQRAWYRSHLEKSYRNLPVFVVPMDWEAHKELHARVDPPIKPPAEIMLGVLALSESMPNVLSSDHTQGLQRVAEHLEGMYSPNDPKCHVAQYIAQNILHQLAYINEGYYHRI